MEGTVILHPSVILSGAKDLLVAAWHQGGERRKEGSDAVPQLTGPAQAVSCRSGSGVTEAAGSYNQPAAFVLAAVFQPHPESVIAGWTGNLYRVYLRFGLDDDSDTVAGVHQGVDHVGGAVRGRVGAVSAFHHALHAVTVQERGEPFRRKAVEG